MACTEDQLGDKVSRTSLSVTETLPDLQSPSQMSLKAGGGSDRESGSRETLTATPTPQTADISEESEPREKVNDKENEESIDDEKPKRVGSKGNILNVAALG